MKPRTADSLERRVEALENCLGTLLIFLAAQKIIGPEDFRLLEDVRHPVANVPEAPRTPEHLTPEVPF